MSKEVSAGAVVYRNTDSGRQYLLLKSRTGDWEFPKGGVEENEELQQAAIREINEEAGIDIKLIDGFRDCYSYIFTAPSGEHIHKEVHLFVGKARSDEVKLSNEHSDMQWKNFLGAKNTVEFSGPRKILKDAKSHLDQLSD